MNFKPHLTTLLKFAPVGALVFFLPSCFYSVQPGEGAIKFNLLTGLGKSVYTEGFHFRIPYLERPIKFNTRTSNMSISIASQNRDLQEVFINADIFFKPDINKLPQIYRTLGPEYAQIVMVNIVKEVLRGVAAQYNAQQLISQRDQLSNQVRNALVIRATQYNIIIEGCTISGIRFSQKYQQAVDEKQAAQQDAERAKYVVNQAKYQGQSIIQRAQTEAEGFKLIGTEAKQNPAFMDLQRITFATELSEILAKARNKVLVNSDMLMVDLHSTLNMTNTSASQGK